MTPALPAATSELFDAHFDLSLTSSVLYNPVRDAGGAVIDFTFCRLNPAAQELLKLPAQGAGTYLGQFSTARRTGAFDFHRAAFESDTPRHFEQPYPADGHDHCLRMAARRVGAQLLVSFTEGPNQPRSAGEETERQHQAQERAQLTASNAEYRTANTALLETQQQLQQLNEAQQDLLEQILSQVPAAIATLSGPTHRFSFANARYQHLVGNRVTVGQTVAEALPEVVEQGVIELLDRVYQTGEPYLGHEIVLMFEQPPGPPHQCHYDLTYLPLRDGQGQVQSILVFAVDVTEQVRSRRQAATLQATALVAAQRRVQQREELYQVFAQMPAAVSLTRGPEHRYAYLNEACQTLFAGRQLLGQAVADALPDAAAQGLLALLDQVYATGETFSGTEVPLSFTAENGTTTGYRYFNFTYQAYREEGQVVGIATFAYDVTEQVQARQQLEASARQLRLLTDALPVLIGYLDRDERYRFTNEAYRAWFNQDPQALLGRPVREVVGERAYANAKPYIDRALAGERVDFESQMPYREDFVKYIRTSFVPDGAAGEPGGFYSLVTDITEQVLARQQVEQANQELEARVRARTQQVAAAQAEAERQRGELERVFEQAPIAIAVYRGPNYVIELANSTVARLWGRTRAQLIGKGLFEALPEVAGLGYEELLDGVMATGVPHVAHAMEAQHDRNGQRETVYWDFVYVPLHEADGTIYGAMVVATEVTAQVLARRQMEQLNQELEARVQRRTAQLTEQQSLLRQILVQVPASIATLSGPEHRFTFFNELYQSLSADRTALGLSVAEVFPEVVAQGFVGLLDGVYATGEPFIGTDVPALLYDARLGRNRQYYVDFIYQPLFDEQQRVQGILAFILDVTDRVHARQQVEHSQRQVQDLNQELLATNEELATSNTRLTRTNTDLDTFVYTASHDLKAPITNIEGILEALRETLPLAVQQDAATARLLGLLHSTVSRFLVTIDQLTDIARLQQTYNEPTELLALAPIVAGVLADLAPAIAAAPAQVHLAVPADLRVSFAPASLRSIVYNLLSNAIKYRDPQRPAQVWLQAEAQAGAVVLTVRDNGLGLTTSQQARLFGLFQRLHTHVEGTGVGLYMIKRLIENAGATITVSSTPGEGSTFTVMIPAFIQV